jgi:regulator of protease activity HflC (stomatin/prohibitin superfamily)
VILRQIAEQQAAITKQQAATQQQVDANVRAIADLRELMAQQAAETVQWFADVVNQADEDRKLIVGLQTENRRILEFLGRHISDGHGAE